MLLWDWTCYRGEPKGEGVGGDLDLSLGRVQQGSYAVRAKPC